jgi:hypothetical protein
MSTSPTSVPPSLVVQPFLGRCEQANERGHQYQEDDRYRCQQLFEVGKLAGWVHEGRYEGLVLGIMVQKRGVL